MRTANSSTGRTVKYLMSQVPRMKKDKQLESIATTTELTKDGELSILINLLQ